MAHPRLKIEEVFDEIAVQMRADFARSQAALSHAGMKGSAVEEIVRAFLREYLPAALDVSTGILIDASGNRTRQLDIVVSDAVSTPILFRAGNIRVIPIECAYFVIEIKSMLDAGELDRTFTNMMSVRNLKKTAYVMPEGPIRHVKKMYGRDWEIWPVNYFVFALDSIALSDLARLMVARQAAGALPEWSRIDSVCVLDKGVIANRTRDGLNALPEPGSKLVASESPRALLMFYALLYRYAGQAALPTFAFAHYIRHLILGVETFRQS